MYSESIILKNTRVQFFKRKAFLINVQEFFILSTKVTSSINFKILDFVRKGTKQKFSSVRVKTGHTEVSVRKYQKLSKQGNKKKMYKI
jgi:hypothetical protein